MSSRVRAPALVLALSLSLTLTLALSLTLALTLSPIRSLRLRLSPSRSLTWPGRAARFRAHIISPYLLVSPHISLYLPISRQAAPRGSAPI